MHDASREHRQKVFPRLRRGPALSLASSLLLGLGCLTSWAHVQIVFFSRSYAGTHFGEGRFTLALAVAAFALTGISATLAPRLVYALPLLGAAALSLTAWKYHDVGDAFASFHGFRLANASAGGGLVLAITASGLMLGGSLLAVLETVHHRQREE